MSMADTVPRSFRGRHALLALAVFFGVMFVVNGIMVYYAVTTFSGGDRPNPYRSGLNYNETIAENARQAALGWDAKASYDLEAGKLAVRVTDDSKAPVSGLKLAGTVVRPTVDSDDRAVTFKEWPEGVYVADIVLEPGNWVLQAETGISSKDASVYRLKQRLIVSTGP